MKKFYLSALFGLAALGVSAANPVFKAEFTDVSNLLKASVGNDMTVNGSGDITKVDGPMGKPAAEVPKGTSLKINLSNSEELSAAGYINSYSIVYDVKFPQMGTWYAFYQTTLDNSDDAEVFISSSNNGIGGYYATSKGDNAGYSDYAFESNKWYRIILSYDCNTGAFVYYVDGQKLMTGNNSSTPDSRYSLPKELLIFGDNDGDDGTIHVSAISIYDKKLTASESRALGGFGNKVTPDPSAAGVSGEPAPYLYDPHDTSMRVNWTCGTGTPGKVRYGISPTALTQTSVDSQCEYLDDDDEVALHSVLLTDLKPSTVYYYSIEGGTRTYSLKTLPADDQQAKIRVLTMSDTHANYQGNTTNIVKMVKASMSSIGIADIHDIDMILHCGDVTDDGDNYPDYIEVINNGLGELAPYIPILAVPGNHDKESDLFFKFFRNDEISAQPSTSPDFKRYWKKQIGSVLFLGLDSWSYWPYDPVICRDRTPGLGEREKAWLEETLQAAENDSSIKMIFAICHECPISELWRAGWQYTFTNTDLYPILKKYSKVQQITFGHAHGTEFGISEPLSDTSTHDIMLFNTGNSGGLLDGWGKIYDADGQQIENPEVNYSHPEYGINIGEIDIQNGTYNFSIYSVAEDDPDASTISAKWLDAPILRETWYGNVEQAAPKAPANINVAIEGTTATVKCDAYDETNPGKLFSTQFQLVQKKSDGSETVLMNSLRDCRNYFKRSDINKNLNLCQFTVENVSVDLPQCSIRARFRDDNRKWSDWAYYGQSSSGIENIMQGNEKLTVFCEAAASTLHVILPGEGLSEIAVYNLGGQIVFKTSLSGRQFSWNYPSKGMYILVVRTAGKVYKHKIAGL